METIKDKFRPGHADLLILKNMELEIIGVVEDLQQEKLLLELLLEQ